MIYSSMAILSGFEARLFNNVLIGYPLLAYCGWQLGITIRPNTKIQKLFNFQGLSGIIVATFTLAFWMIPNWMELGVTNTLTQLTKHLSILLLVGLPLGASWSQSNFIIRGFVKIELLSMLLRLGWIYLISPTRLCNIYSLNEQNQLGIGLLILAMVLSIYYLYPLFVSPNKTIIRAQA